MTVSYVISSIFSQEVIKQTSSAVQQKMSVITGILDNDLETIKNTYSKLVNNKEIKRLMAQNPQDEKAARDRMFAMGGVLSQYYGENYLINRIIAIDTKKNVLDLLYSNPIYSSEIINNKGFREFIRSNNYNMFSEPSVFPKDTPESDNNDKLIITYYTQYLNNANYSSLGYMLINFNKLVVFNKIASNCRAVFDTTYIINRDGKLVYRIGDLEYSKSIFDSLVPGDFSHNNTVNIKKTKYLIFAQSLESNPNWTVVGLISYNRLTQKVGFMNFIIYVLGFVCLLLVIFISYFIGKRITDPIFVVNKAMQRFENGEWPDKLEIQSDIEIRYLIRGFNSMIDHIRNLIDTIYLEQENKKKAEVTALKFQLESLQSQINPHFMYNTLNAVSYLAMKRGADDIREMIQSFNMLLSASMSTSKEFITINEEIECILSYLKLQRYRYDFDFQFVCDVPEELKEYKIPRLILQPLVENSLFHGIALKDFPGTIKVSFERDDKRIKISTIDDGVGIIKSDLPYIINKNKARNKSAFNNIGLANVDERLKLYFGEDYRLQIFSNRGIGTCVMFYIPMSES